MASVKRDLLLFPIGGTTFGVWEADISSVSPPRPLHRLPLSPSAVAGMAIIEDKGATIFDLAVCLGMADGGQGETTRFLLLRSAGETLGFRISGAIETYPCSEDLVTAMPETVRTAVVDACLVRNGTIIPLLQIRRLEERLLQGVLDVPEPAPLNGRGRRDPSPARSLRLVALGGRTFCVRGEEPFSVLAPGTPMTALHYARRNAEGVVLHDGAVLPVVPVQDRIGIRGRAGAGGLLIAHIDGGRYAFPIDEDRGEPGSTDPSVLPLPPIARTACIHEAIEEDGEVIPVLELSALLDDRKGGEAGEDLAGAYSPDSCFSRDFRRTGVEVTQFSLLGNLHALPKEEVKEIVAPLPYRSIPGVPEIVLGVAAREGRMLPVLDLAAIFGRRTFAGPASRMLRIANGDFHALVLVEEAGAMLQLQQELQRKVPIALPFEVLYGCYLDGRAVRLIMNVLALAVHFERTEMRELVAGLAPPAEPVVVEQRPATPAWLAGARAEQRPEAATEPGVAHEELQPVLPGGTAGTDGEMQPIAPLEPAESEGEHLPEEPAAAGTEVPERTEETRPTAHPGSARFGRTIAAAAAHERSQAQEALRQRQAAEAAQQKEAKQREEEEERARERVRKAQAEELRAQEEAAARARAVAEAAAAKAEQERAAADAARQREEAEALALAEAEAAAKAKEQAEADQRAAAEAQAKKEEETARVRKEEEKRAAEAEAQARREEEARRAAEEKARQEREAAARAARMQQAAAVEDERQRAAARFQEVVEEEFAASPGGRRPRAEVTVAPAGATPSRSRRSLAVAAIIAALLVLLLYWIGGPSKQRSAPPAVAPEQRAEEKEPEAPLVLDVPATMPRPEVIVYVVVKGDTLWDISKRFTGDPFNYPRVAKDNSIATPDLIFPGQRIRLRQQ